MAGTTTTEAEVLKEYWNNDFLMNLRSELVFFNLGKVSNHPKNNGTTVHWLSIADLSAASTLTEATDPTAFTLSAGDITAGLKQYGGIIEVSGLLEDTAINGYMGELRDKVLRNSKKTVDQVGIRDAILTAGGIVQYAGGAVSRNSLAASADYRMDIDEVRKAVTKLKANDVEPLEGGKYVAVLHPNAVYDVQADSNWKDYVRYNNFDRISNGYIGDLYGAKFVETSEAWMSAGLGSGSSTVYQSYVFGKEAFGVSEMYTGKIIVNSPSKKTDLEMYSSMGWKSTFAATQLQQSALVRIEHTVS